MNLSKLYPFAGLVVLAVIAYIALTAGQKAQNLPADGWKQYVAPAFTIAVPPGYTAEQYAYTIDALERITSSGVKFPIDPAMASGTNLSADSYVSVERIPTLSACNAGAYIYGNEPVESLIDEGKAYSVATSSGAGAGNFYEEWVYVRTDNPGICPAVRYYIHTTNLANYPEGTVQAYNREALLEEFDKIRLSLETK